MWLRPARPGHRAQAVWHAWQDGAAYVLTGGLEQPVPAGLDGGEPDAYVTVRSKDKGAGSSCSRHAVGRVEPGSEEWAAVMPALLAQAAQPARRGAAAGERWAARVHAVAA